MRRILAVSAVLAAAAIALAACGGSTPNGSGTGTSSAPPAAQPSNTPSVGASTGATTQAATAMITIKNFGYTVSGPVTPGEKITVKNEDDVNHTVTADQSNSLFNVNVNSNGGTATFTAPAKPGAYKFHCNYHANMHGTLTVK